MSKKADAGVAGPAEARVFFENNIGAYCLAHQKMPGAAGLYLVNIAGDNILVRVGYATINHYDQHAFDGVRPERATFWEIWIKWHDTRLFHRYRLHGGSWRECPPIYFPEPPLSGMERAPVGEVYFILNENKSLVKIGQTIRLKNRLSSLQTSSAENLCVIGRILTKRPERLEAKLHKRFAKDRVRGEWFRYSDELKSFISKENTNAGGCCQETIGTSEVSGLCDSPTGGLSD